jgi:hypothetical protein
MLAIVAGVVYTHRSICLWVHIARRGVVSSSRKNEKTPSAIQFAGGVLLLIFRGGTIATRESEPE